MATPYSIKKLPPEIATALTPYAPYRTTSAVKALVDAMQAPPSEALVCLADLQWHDGLATDFDEDVLQFGEEALATLARVPELGSHAGAGRLRREIERRRKVAEREIKKVMKLAATPDDALHLDEAKELVFTILDNSGSSRELLRKAYRLAQRCAREIPDVVVRDGTAFHGNHLYYSHHAAEALWRAGDHAEARPLLCAVAEWPIDRDVKLYDFAVQQACATLLDDAVARDASAEVERWLCHLRDRLAAVGVAATLHFETVATTAAYAVARPTLALDAVGALLHAAGADAALSAEAAADVATLRARTA